MKVSLGGSLGARRVVEIDGVVGQIECWGGWGPVGSGVWGNPSTP